MAAKSQMQQRYADGGPTGGQPTMGLQYADGGTIGMSSDPQSPANLDTPTANQNFGDYLRQQSDAGGSAGLQYPGGNVTQAPATPKGGNSTLGGNTPAPSTDGTGVADGTSGSLASTVGTMAFGPVVGGLLGVGTNFADGYNTGTTAPNSPTASVVGANTPQFGLLNSMSNAFFGTPLSTPVAANPMQADPATVAANNMAAATDAGNPGGGGFASNGNNGMGANANNNGMGANSTNGARGAVASGSTSSEGGHGGDPGVGGGVGGHSGDNGGFANGGQIGQQMPVQQGANPTVATAGLQPQGGPPATAPAPDMHPAIAHLHVQNQLSNPQILQAIQTHISQAIQAGKVNPQQLQMMGQLAQSAMQHPEIWPKLRQFAIQVGLPDAQKLPEQFNQQLCMTLMAASQASQHGDRPGAFKNGGMLHGPGTGTSDSIQAQNTSSGQPVKLSNGEYIIPADVVATKGKEFFDNIVRKYHTPAAMQHGR